MFALFRAIHKGGSMAASMEPFISLTWPRRAPRGFFVVAWRLTFFPASRANCGDGTIRLPGRAHLCEAHGQPGGSHRDLGVFSNRSDKAQINV
jgi:hypothetical protein